MVSDKGPSVTDQAKHRLFWEVAWSDSTSCGGCSKSIDDAPGARGHVTVAARPPDARIAGTHRSAVLLSRIETGSEA